MRMDGSSVSTRWFRPAAWLLAALRALWRVASAIARWRRRVEVRRQYARLSELDDHMLKDIGLTRRDVHREASRSSFWR